MAVQSIERAFILLRTIAQHPDGIGVSELARSTALHKSTVSRLISALESEQAVERLSTGEGVRIGSGIFGLASHASFPHFLQSIARPFIEELAHITGETVYFCLPESDRVHYADQINSRYHIQLRDWIGDRLPIHAVASGKVFLAYWPNDELDSLLSKPLEQITPRTITAPKQLRKQLARIQADGFVWMYEEYELGLAACSAPIRNHQDQVVAAITLGGPLFRFPSKGRQGQLAKSVMETAAAITARLIESTPSNRLQTNIHINGLRNIEHDSTDEGSETLARK